MELDDLKEDLVERFNEERSFSKDSNVSVASDRRSLSKKTRASIKKTSACAALTGKADRSSSKRRNSRRHSAVSLAQHSEELSRLHQLGDMDLLRRTYSKARTSMILSRTQTEELHYDHEVEEEEVEDDMVATGTGTSPVKKAFFRAARALGVGAAETLQERRRRAENLARVFIAAKNRERVVDLLTEEMGSDCDDRVTGYLNNIFKDLLELGIKDIKKAKVSLQAVFGTKDLEELGNLKRMLESELEMLSNTSEAIYKQREKVALIDGIVNQAAFIQQLIQESRASRAADGAVAPNVFAALPRDPDPVIASATVEPELQAANSTSEQKTTKQLFEWAVHRITAVNLLSGQRKPAEDAATGGRDVEDVAELVQGSRRSSPLLHSFSRMTSQQTQSDANMEELHQIAAEEFADLHLDEERLAAVTEALAVERSLAELVQDSRPGSENKQYNISVFQFPGGMEAAPRSGAGSKAASCSRSAETRSETATPLRERPSQPEAEKRVQRRRKATPVPTTARMPQVFRGIVNRKFFPESKKALKSDKTKKDERWQGVLAMRPVVATAGEKAERSRPLSAKKVEMCPESRQSALRRIAKKVDGRLGVEDVFHERSRLSDISSLVLEHEPVRVPKLALQPLLGLHDPSEKVPSLDMQGVFWPAAPSAPRFPEPSLSPSQSPSELPASRQRGRAPSLGQQVFRVNDKPSNARLTGIRVFQRMLSKAGLGAPT
eukprot:TRINITY_DN22913_c0_g1_i1.p1 TRINITY_DN22913_c0_g1~~TRINITY_DN22913_c0_g1_i1.p1  ORF type:complete len:723 (-),score=165.07 TRINITY_DN22913_c0_g1_i1:90-2258(-)